MGPLVPVGVVIVTFLNPVVAVPEIVNVALTVVEFTTLMPLAVTPVPLTVIAVAPVRLVPVRVTGTLAPRAPCVGAIEVSVGGPGATTVNVTLPEVPPAVVTLTFRAPVAAVAEIVKFAVTEVAVAVTLLTVMSPLLPDTLIVAPDRLLPDRVTGMLVAPCTP